MVDNKEIVEALHQGQAMETRRQIQQKYDDRVYHGMLCLVFLGFILMLIFA